MSPSPAVSTLYGAMPARVGQARGSVPCSCVQPVIRWSYEYTQGVGRCSFFINPFSVYLKSSSLHASACMDFQAVWCGFSWGSIKSPSASCWLLKAPWLCQPDLVSAHSAALESYCRCSKAGERSSLYGKASQPSELSFGGTDSPGYLMDLAHFHLCRAHPSGSRGTEPHCQHGQ